MKKIFVAIVIPCQIYNKLMKTFIFYRLLCISSVPMDNTPHYPLVFHPLPIVDWFVTTVTWYHSVSLLQQKFTLCNLFFPSKVRFSPGPIKKRCFFSSSLYNLRIRRGILLKWFGVLLFLPKSRDFFAGLFWTNSILELICRGNFDEIVDHAASVMRLQNQLIIPSSSDPMHPSFGPTFVTLLMSHPPQELWKIYSLLGGSSTFTRECGLWFCLS